MNEELKKWIADYDNGNIVESVSMGGISKGYEIAIQDCAIETMRQLQIIPIPEDNKLFGEIVKTAGDKSADLLNKKYGFSGAQVGAAKNLASVFWRRTPEKGLQMMREQEPRRIIQIQKVDTSPVLITHDIKEIE